jgi:uncharacterized phage-associated protein
MVSVFDVAALILREKSQITAMKLQKLVYYCQAWSLIWDEKPLFKESIEAWINGPVVRELYEQHKGLFYVTPNDMTGNPENLNEEQRETVLAVLRDYGDKPSQWLSDLTHSENPWQEARKGLLPNERGHHKITIDSMAEYYEAVYRDGIDLNG